MASERQKRISAELDSRLPRGERGSLQNELRKLVYRFLSQGLSFERSLEKGLGAVREKSPDFEPLVTGATEPPAAAVAPPAPPQEEEEAAPLPEEPEPPAGTMEASASALLGAVSEEEAADSEESEVFTKTIVEPVVFALEEKPVPPETADPPVPGSLGSGRNRREASRYHVKPGTFAYFRTGGARASSPIGDLSLGGLYILDAQHQFKLDARLELGLSLGKDLVRVKGIVVRAVAGHGFAVRFEDVPEADRARLEAYLRRLGEPTA